MTPSELSRNFASLDLDDFFDATGRVDLTKAFCSVVRDEETPGRWLAIWFLEDVQAIHPIKSRQVAALCLATATQIMLRAADQSTHP